MSRSSGRGNTSVVKLAFDITVPKENVTSLKYHPVSEQLYTGGSDGVIIRWNKDFLSRKALHFKDEQQISCVNDIDFSSNGDIMVSAHQNSIVRIWEPKLNGSVKRILAHKGGALSVCVHPCDNSRIVTGGGDNTVKLWSIEHTKTNNGSLYFQTHYTINDYKEHTNTVRSVRYSRDGRLFCSSSDDNTIRLYDARRVDTVATMTCPFGKPTHADFRPDRDEYVGISLNDGGFIIFDTRKLDVIQTHKNLSLDHSPINAFAFHPSGNYAVCGFDNSGGIVLDLIQGRSIGNLPRRTTKVLAVDYINRRHFVTGGEYQELLVWEAKLPFYYEHSNLKGSNPPPVAPEANN